MPTPTIPPMQQMPLLKIAPITCQMILSIQPLSVRRHLAHPTNLLARRIRHHQLGALLTQLFSHGIDVDTKVISEELAHLGILMISHQRHRRLGVRAVDIDVRGRVAMGAPARLAASGHHVCVLVEGGGRVVYEV